MRHRGQPPNSTDFQFRTAYTNEAIVFCRIVVRTSFSGLVKGSYFQFERVQPRTPRCQLMHIIFSRKGFDSGSGGCPSPIIDGCPVSLPIPTSHRSETTYDQLGLGDIVERLTRARVTRDHLCHEDPMFAGDRCAFGQTGVAQSHLSRYGVGVGDIFLFFGLFSDEATGERHHRVFGFLSVRKVTTLGPRPSIEDDPAGLPRRHPHTIGEWNKNNTLYLGEGALCRSASDELRLTQVGGPLSVWQTPIWLREVGLTYHGRDDRWLAADRLKVVARGQEFVAHIGSDDEPQKWLQAVIGAIKE